MHGVPIPPPHAGGGNIDCRHLTAGTTLYLPVGVPGGLLSLGDAHAAQGDGEVADLGRRVRDGDDASDHGRARGHAPACAGAAARGRDR